LYFIVKKYLIALLFFTDGEGQVQWRGNCFRAGGQDRERQISKKKYLESLFVPKTNVL